MSFLRLRWSMCWTSTGASEVICRGESDATRVSRTVSRIADPAHGVVGQVQGAHEDAAQDAQVGEAGEVGVGDREVGLARGPPLRLAQGLALGDGVLRGLGLRGLVLVGPVALALLSLHVLVLLVFVLLVFVLLVLVLL